MPIKCHTCKHCTVIDSVTPRIVQACTNATIAAQISDIIGSPANTVSLGYARDICDRESNGIFVHYEPKTPAAGAAAFGVPPSGGSSPVSEPGAVATGSTTTSTTQPEQSLKAAA